MYFLCGSCSLERIVHCFLSFLPSCSLLRARRAERLQADLPSQVTLLVLTAAGPVCSLLLDQSQPGLQRWEMKGPIKASWKYSACTPPSSAAPLSPPCCTAAELWLTCELQRAVMVIRAVPGPATRPAVIPPAGRAWKNCCHHLKTQIKMTS